MTDTTTCPDCGGEGQFDGPILCPGLGCTCGGYSGGCTKPEKCDRCQGEGEITLQCDSCGDDIEDGMCFYCLHAGLRHRLNRTGFPEDDQVNAIRQLFGGNKEAALTGEVDLLRAIYNLVLTERDYERRLNAKFKP